MNKRVGLLCTAILAFLGVAGAASEELLLDHFTAQEHWIFTADEELEASRVLRFDLDVSGDGRREVLLANAGTRGSRSFNWHIYARLGSGKSLYLGVAGGPLKPQAEQVARGLREYDGLALEVLSLHSSPATAPPAAADSDLAHMGAQALLLQGSENWEWLMRKTPASLPPLVGIELQEWTPGLVGSVVGIPSGGTLLSDALTQLALYGLDERVFRVDHDLDGDGRAEIFLSRGSRVGEMERRWLVYSPIDGGYRALGSFEAWKFRVGKQAGDLKVLRRRAAGDPAALSTYRLDGVTLRSTGGESQLEAAELQTELTLVESWTSGPSGRQWYQRLGALLTEDVQTPWTLAGSTTQLNLSGLSLPLLAPSARVRER